ncbi:MAG: copper resistance protein CopC [Chloroflexi bacterium]|nr:copper resistance protein CopC [Chloroflexota bacterium]
MHKTYRTKRYAVSLWAAFGLLLACAGVALAHAKLVKSDPAADSTVTTAPQTVTIWFNEELDTKLSNIKVQDPGGAPVDLGNSKVNLDDRKQLTVGLKQPLANGVYTVIWHAVTPDDGGISDGRFKFTLAVSGQPAAATSAPVQTAPTIAPAQATTSSSPSTSPVTSAPSPAASTGFDPAGLLIVASLVIVAAGAVLLLRRK